MSLYENLSKDELIDLMKAYDCYISTAADAGRFETGWIPASISDFVSCEYQDVWRQGEKFDYMYQEDSTDIRYDPKALQELITLSGVRIFSENHRLMCHFGKVGDRALEMHVIQSRIQDIKQGNAFIAGAKIYLAAEDAHQNQDEPDRPWVVYDQRGNAWFEEDITPAWDGLEKIINYHHLQLAIKRPLCSLMKTASARSTAGLSPLAERQAVLDNQTAPTR